MENGIESLHSNRVAAGRTSYFMDVRKAVNGRFYITLTESRRASDSGFDQSRVFVFEEYAEPFREALEGAFHALGEAVRERGGPPDPGTGVPGRCGMRWTGEEDGRLTARFRGGSALEDIAAGLDRSRRAVELRLEKLGLMPARAPEPVSGPPRVPSP